MKNKLFSLFLIISLSANFQMAYPQQAIPDLIHTTWKAHWIISEGASEKAYGIYLFRKSLDLPEKPGKFIVYVSADNRYKFYVNEVLVSIGPARGDITHYHYETLDLGPYLKAGKNILAAKVWNEAEFRPEAQVSLGTGFILQGEGAMEQIVNTDPSWKSIQDTSYKPIKIGFTRTYYVAGPGEFIDMRTYFHHWMKMDFPDAGWKSARSIEPGVPKYILNGFANMESRLLIPSFLPPRELTVQRLALVRKSSGIPIPESFPKLKSDITLPANTTATLLLDQGFLTNAYPTLLFSGGKDAEISIRYAESLFSNFPGKGNRDMVEGKQMIGRRDSLISDGSANQDFTALNFRTYRYVEIKVSTKEQPLILNDFFGTFTGYPFIQQAKIESENPEFKQILDIGWRTARLCAFETYMDCPFYEQLQYIGDGRIQALVSLYNSGDDRLVKNALNQMDESRIPEGLTESRHPSYTRQYINTFSLWYIGMLHDYLFYGPDTNFIKNKLDGERQVLDFFKRFQEPDGSLKNLPYWSFTDWVEAKGWIDGVAPIGKDRYSAALDLQLLWAYQNAEDLESRMGSKEMASTYHSISETMKKTIFKNYWVKERSLFADTREKDTFSQHVNTLAILTGIIKGEEAKALGKRMLDDQSLAPASIYFKYYLHRALIQVGMGNDYLSWLGVWKKNIEMGMTTWAEFSDISNSRSDCHAWGSSPNIEFFRTLLGIDSDAPGFTQVKIEPHLGHIKTISGEMPHPFGKIKVAYLVKNGIQNARIELPNKLIGKFIWKNKEFRLHPGVNAFP